MSQRTLLSALLLTAAPLAGTLPTVAQAQAPLVKNQADTTYVWLRVGGIEKRADALRLREGLEAQFGRGTVTLQPDYSRKQATLDVKSRLLVDGNRVAQECRRLGFSIQQMEQRTGPAAPVPGLLPNNQQGAGPAVRPGFGGGFPQANGGLRRLTFQAFPIRNDIEGRRLTDALRKVTGVVAVELVPVPNQQGSVEVRLSTQQSVTNASLYQAARSVGIQLR